MASARMAITGRPCRSVRRPTLGLEMEALAAMSRKIAPVPAAVTPRRASVSGAVALMTPKPIPPRASSQNPRRSRWSRSRRNACSQPGDATRCGAGKRWAIAASEARRSPSPTKSAVGPTTVPTTPNTGPRMPPITARPSTRPISSPRRSAGAIVETHTIAPVQARTPPTPCRKRKPMSCGPVETVAKSTHVTAAARAPACIVGRAPRREQSIPAGNAPATMPRG